MVAVDESSAVARAVAAHDRALAELSAGRAPAGRAAASQAVELLVRALGANNPDVANVLITASQIEQAVGDLTAARTLAARAVNASRTWGHRGDDAEALPAWEPADGDLVALRFEAEVHLATIDQTLGDLDGAEHQLLDALAEARTIVGAERSILLLTNALGVTYKFAGRLDDAQRCYDQAYDLIMSAAIPDPADLAGLFHNFAGLAHSRGDPGTGILWAERGITIRATLEDAELDLARDYGGLGALHHLAGHVDDARDDYAKAERGFVALLGPEHYEAAVVLANRAALEAEYGEQTVALDLYRRALTLLTAVLGPDHAEVRHVRNNLSVLTPD